MNVSFRSLTADNSPILARWQSQSEVAPVVRAQRLCQHPSNGSRAGVARVPAGS